MKFQIYGFCILLSILACYLYALFNYDRSKFTLKETLIMITFSFYGTVSGAIVLTWVERLFHGENVSLYNIGLSSHGALLGLIASLWIFAKVAKKRAKDVLYTFSPLCH